jgi:putative oxidoreductase
MPMNEKAMTLDDRLQSLAPYVLSILRIVVGLLFFEHGLAKMFGFPGPQVPFDLSLHWFSGLIEFAGGALLAVGLFTRASAFIMSGEMAFGYFLSHAPRSLFPLLNGGDAAILYCFIFFYFVFAGGGPWALDGLFRDRAVAQGARREQRA